MHGLHADNEYYNNQMSYNNQMRYISPWYISPWYISYLGTSVIYYFFVLDLVLDAIGDGSIICMINFIVL